MSLINFYLLKNKKMRSLCRHLCLFILLFSALISCSDANSDYVNGNTNINKFRQTINFTQFNAKTNINRSFDEPHQQPHHHLRHQHNTHHHHHQNSGHYRAQHHTKSNQPSNHYQHHNNHQSNDNAFHYKLPLPDNNNSRQTHSPRRYDAPATTSGGSSMMIQKYRQQQQPRNRITTQGPDFRQHHHRNSNQTSNKFGANNSNLSSNSFKWHKERIGLAPTGSHINRYGWNRNRVSASINRFEPYKTRETPIITKATKATTTTTTTTTTSTTTPEPIYQNKISFDGAEYSLNADTKNDIENDENNNNNEEENYEDDDDENDDELDYTNDNDYSVFNSDNFNSRKKSSNIQRHHAQAYRFNENIQKDDPIRSNDNISSGTSTHSNSNAVASKPLKEERQLHRRRAFNDNYNNNNMNNDASTTKNATTSNAQIGNSNIPGVLTEEKRRTLSTHDAVDQAFQNQQREDKERRLDKSRKDAELVNAHKRRLFYQGRCKIPKPKIIPVSANHTSKTYTPHCTILHRCGDDTGCCMSDNLTCQPKTIVDVSVPFWVTMDGQVNVEYLTLTNHTVCHCVEKNHLLENKQNLPAMDEPASSATPPITASTSTPTTTTKPTLPPVRCHCPKHFTKIDDKLSACRCDCSSEQSHSMEICTRLKNGLEHFSFDERRCIRTKDCAEPTCAYGVYENKNGHCPQKGDVQVFASNALESY